MGVGGGPGTTKEAVDVFSFIYLFDPIASLPSIILSFFWTKKKKQKTQQKHEPIGSTACFLFFFTHIILICRLKILESFLFFPNVLLFLPKQWSQDLIESQHRLLLPALIPTPDCV